MVVERINKEVPIADVAVGAKPTKYTGMRIKRSIKAIGEKNAQLEHRSLANYVEKLILGDDARRRG